MSDNSYKGWTNYETWRMALWLNEVDFLGRCEDNGITEIDSEMLDAELYLLAGAEDMTAFEKDIYNGWLSCANLNEIADSFNSDLEREQ